MIGLLLDPGMLIAPENPSEEQALTFYERIDHWKEFVSERNLEPIISIASHTYVNTHTFFHTYKPLERASQGVYDAPTLYAAIQQFLNATQQIGDFEQEVDTLLTVSPDQIKSRLPEEGIEEFVEASIWCSRSLGDWGVISDVKGDMFEGTYIGHFGREDASRFEGGLFNNSNDYLRNIPFSDIYYSMFDPYGFSDALKWSWLNDLEPDIRRTHTIGRYRLGPNFLSSLERVCGPGQMTESEARSALSNIMRVLADSKCDHGCLRRLGSVNVHSYKTDDFKRFSLDSVRALRVHFDENQKFIYLGNVGDHDLNYMDPMPFD